MRWSNQYNNRLQSTLLSAAKPGATRFSRFYGYGAAQQNNGNITQITDNLNSDRSVSYTYDSLNRIASAQSANTDCSPVPANPSITKNWGNTFTVDPWGNLTAKNVTKCSSEALSTAVSVKNQLGIGTHDAAGNLLNNGGASYTYDSENRIATTAGVTYTYDGDGNRVKKSNGTLYWGESFTGGPIAETDLSGVIKAEYVYFNGKRIARRDYSSNSTHYYFSDHLNSSSLVASSGGAVEEDSDFYPYGGERAYTFGPNHYKFTGKERDTESYLDYFGARYYASTMGRFTSPDPKLFSMRTLLNPQKWNKYSYVLNNPLSLFDPDGMEERTLVYRTFIPQNQVTVLGQHFAGDNRGFSTAANASSRTSITVRIETDPAVRANPIISVSSTAGQSARLDANGNVVKTATATNGLPTATGSRDANGNAVINIQQDTKNPLSPGPQALTPGITANLNVTVSQDGSNTSVTGTASNFPAEELNVTSQDGNTTPVMQFMPSSDASPFSLFLPDRNVNTQKATPSCSTDDKGKKVCSQ